MRSTPERLRRAMGFEIIGLRNPARVLLFGMSMHVIGVIALASSGIATGWTYFYNLIFDRVKLRLRGDTRKTVALRLVHAAAFVIGLLVALVPLIAWHLDVSLWQALLLDATVAGFYLVYAFGFNWLYDLIFPVRFAPDQAAARV